MNLACTFFGHRITGRAWIASKGRYESYCSRCDRNLPGPRLDLREVEVIGYRSILDQLPGVRREDVIALRRRRWITQPPQPARVLIVRRNLLDNPGFEEGWT